MALSVGVTTGVTGIGWALAAGAGGVVLVSTVALVASVVGVDAFTLGVGATVAVTGVAGFDTTGL